LKIQGYNIDLENAAKKIKNKNYKTVVLQVPEGLKSYSFKFVDLLEKETPARVIISADPCFGACDIVDSEFKKLGAEFVIQIGHTPILYDEKPEIPTMFINAESENDITKVINKAIPKFKDKKIGLTTTAQHIHKLEEIKKILIENNF